MTTQAQARAALQHCPGAYADMGVIESFINENPDIPHTYTRPDVENITNKLRGNKKWAEYVRRYRRSHPKATDQEWSTLADGYMAGMVDLEPGAFRVYFDTPFTVTVS